MRKIVLIFIVFSILCGCSNNITINHKNEVSSYTEEKISIEDIGSLSLNIDAGEIEIYNWDNEEIKFEMTKRVRGNLDKAQLEKKLDDFDVKLNKDSKNIEFISKFKGNIKAVSDKSMDMKIYLSKRINKLDLKMDIGKIKLVDDFKGEIKGDFDYVQTDINNIEGSLNINGHICDINIGNGNIVGESKIICEIGNINIRSDINNITQGVFETGIGNINLNFPENLKTALKIKGNLKTNDFKDIKSEKSVTIISEMGEININKY